MLCPKCQRDNSPDAVRCVHCGSSTAIAALEVTRGSLAERLYYLGPRHYTIGRAAHNDLALQEPSISKSHARLVYQDGAFSVEDDKSLHGVYVNAAKTTRAPLVHGALLQLGNVTFKFKVLGSEGTTDKIAQFPWVEHQQLLLSLVQTLNSTLVLSEVLVQVLDAVMRITRAERGYLLLAEADPEHGHALHSIAGLHLRVGRRRGGIPIDDVQGLSSSVIRKAVESGETVATGNAVADPSLGLAKSVILMDLRTIVCIPLRSPRSEGPGPERGLGALYVDNPETSASFPPDSLRAAEALARHAALAIENAQLFEREKRTTQELRIAQNQLLQAEKLATIGRMAAGLAHELNTPLTYIMGNLEMLQMQSLSEDQTEMLAAVNKGVERIRGLGQNLLAFSRPAQEQPVPVDINVLVERALEFCHYQSLKVGLQVEKRLDPALPSVPGDASQLEMALINLIVNAGQAMAGRDVRLLTITTCREDGEVEIRVADSGPGIPDEIQPTVFEPFVTTKAAGEGTGLGLSTVLMIAQRHRGRIDFTTEPGSGTEFRLRLPTL
jgi:signal transduction histidine kinase